MMRRAPQQAFALVLVLVLVAVALLVTLALAAMSKIGHDAARANEHRVQARQNALVGLQLAIGKIDHNKSSGSTVATALADISSNSRRENRYWTAMWVGGFPIWLVSGDQTPAEFLPSLTALPPPSSNQPWRIVSQRSGEIVLIGHNSIQTGTNSLTYQSGDAVVVPTVVLPDSRGRYAYWVGDEGVKANVLIDASTAQLGQGGAILTPDWTRPLNSFVPSDSNNAKVIYYDQLSRVASGSDIKRAFHYLTINSRAPLVDVPYANNPIGGMIHGAFNVNSTNDAAWRMFLESPVAGQTHLSISATNSGRLAQRIRARLIERGRPYESVEDFINSGIIAESLNEAPRINNITEQAIIEILRPVWSVHSRTFRVRAYGDSFSVDVDASQGAPEAVAYCEGIVQIDPEGRTYLTYFRWLTPADI